MNAKVNISIILFFVFSFVYYCPGYAENSSIESSQRDELDDIEKPRITTKVYKSTDPYFEYLDEDTNIDPTLETDILNKKELIYNHEKNKIKYVSKFKKEISNQNTFNKKFIILPWIGLLTLSLFLLFIFKYLKK